jgi:hypothetical protein
MSEARKASIAPDAGPGIYLDQSGTGAGKSDADKILVNNGGRSAIVTPTHENAKEVVGDMLASGFDAKRYPKRISKQSSMPFAEPQNCHYPLADEVERAGFSVLAVACPGCPFKTGCRYVEGVKAATEASISVATHMRAARQSLASLAEGRRLLSIHEDSINILRPRETIAADAMFAVRAVVDRMLNDPQYLNTETGKQHEFLIHLAAVVDLIILVVSAAVKTTAVELPDGQEMPGSVQRLIFNASKSSGMIFADGVWRVVTAAASGMLESLTIQICDGRETESLQKILVAVWRNDPPEHCVTWLQDATAQAEVISNLLGRIVNDKTPSGEIEFQKSATQIPVDITRETSPDRVLGIIRDILASRPAWQRAGIISHSTHHRQIERMRRQDAVFGSRIKRTSYFGRGDDRGSNAWHRECDSLIVLGTPRPGGDEVKTYLIQTGRIEAAMGERPAWGNVHYTARDEAGNVVKVTGRGYADPTWQRAFQSRCRAALVQAVGRGRGICEDGIPAIVVSTEETGLTISSLTVDAINDLQGKIMNFVTTGDPGCAASDGDDLHIGKVPRSAEFIAASGCEAEAADRGSFPINNNYRESSTIRVFTAREIAKGVGHDVESVKKALRSLYRRGLIEKVGGGHSTKWKLASKRGDDQPDAAIMPLPEPSGGGGGDRRPAFDLASLIASIDFSRPAPVVTIGGAAC